MSKSKFIWLVVIIIIVAGIVVSTRDDSDKVIQIGAPIPLTGTLASAGERVKNGYDLALLHVNERYDFTLEILYEDTHTETDTALSAIRKLIDLHGVSVVMGPFRSTSVLAAAPVTEEHEVILFTPISSADGISDAGDFVFRNRESAKSHGIGMAEYLFENGYRKAALFVAQSANSKTYGDFFKQGYKAIGGELAYVLEYPEELADFRAEITKAMDKGVEAVYLAVATGQDAALLTRQFEELGYDGLITGSVAFETDEFKEAIEGGGQGVIITAPYFDPSDDALKDFLAHYRVAYGKDADVWSANAYDAIHLIAAAIDDCGDDDSSCIRDYLYGVKEYPGMGGITTFDENGDVIKPVMFRIYEGSQFVPFEG